MRYLPVPKLGKPILLHGDDVAEFFLGVLEDAHGCLRLTHFLIDRDQRLDAESGSCGKLQFLGDIQEK